MPIEAAQTVLPKLPDTLVALGLNIRECSEDDLSFMRDLYASTRWEELEPTGWTYEAKIGFLHDQFRLQHAHYSKYYPHAAVGIVEVAGGPAGRLYLLQMPGDLRVVDIAFLPEHRNRGYGSALLQSVFRQAASLGSKVSIHVETNNPAKRLYQRLGFRSVTQEGFTQQVYELMEWVPEAVN